MMPQRANLTDRAKRYRAQNAVRGNWPWASKPAPAPRRRSSLTIAGASRLAREAGYRGTVPFDEWLERKKLSGRGSAVVSGLARAYSDGLEKRERDDQRKQDAREAKREASRERAETRQSKVSKRRAEKEISSKLGTINEEKLKEHYARGGNLAEYLQANPAAARDWERRNRAEPHSTLGDKLDRIDREILGAVDFKKRAAWLKKREQVWNEAMGKNPGRRNPDPLTASFLGDQLGKVASKLKKKVTGNPPQVFYRDVDKRGRERFYHDANVGRRLVLYPVEEAKLLIATGQARVIAKGKRNPAGAAASLYQEFHGRPSGELVEVDKPVHYHAHLAALGELEKLTIKSNDGGLVDLEGFGDAVLCSNERGTQLYIEGGDQAVKLSAFGIGKPYHDVEDLGEVTKLWYFTTKDHLGDQGGEASYHHTLSEEKKTRMSYGFGERRAPKPRLLYDVLNQGLAFAGGEYSVEPEGIRN